MTRKESKIRKRINPNKVILIMGILLISLSFFMEINFHYIQQFTSENVEISLFWRAENSIWPISLTLLISGSVLIGIYFYNLKITKKKR